MKSIIAATLVVVLGASSAHAQNPNPELLTNPGFENSAIFWGTFGNVFLEMANPPQFVPNQGMNLVSMFGLFNPSGQSDSGVFQRFLCQPGETYELNASARHFSGDALSGMAPSGNFVLMRIAFFDGSQNEIPGSGNDRIILDGSFATDTWHTGDPVKAQAPAGAVTAQALIIFIQPGLNPGAAHIDDVTFKRSIGLNVNRDPMNNDVLFNVDSGEPFSVFVNLFSADPQNFSMPQMGPLAGLFITLPEFNSQINLGLSAIEPFGGLLDGTGNWSYTLPSAATVGLSGVNLVGLSIQISSGTGLLDPSSVTLITL